MLDIGYNLTLGQTSPTGRAYTVSSIANFGTITATAPLFQSEFFTNDGIIFADTNGSIAINASELTLGSLGAGATNYLVAEGNVTLSAQSIEVTNSEIVTGALTLDVTSSITDGVSAGAGLTPGMVNYWQLSAGFNMPVNPAAGNLLGTEIRTTASGYNVASHVWAGVDYPDDPVAGFANNVVIGHLVLDRLTNTATLRFSGAGTKNAMYVDYLELADASYTDYRNGLIIDTNSIKIYFTSANADPAKLTNVYPGGLIWVPNGLTASDSTIVTTRITAPAPVPPSLKVSTVGQGTVGPAITAKQLAAGGTHTLTAAPAKGWTFSGWTASGIAGGADTTTPVLKFNITGSAAVTANFIKNPFGPMQGVYNGLFYDPNGVSAGSAGFFTLTLASSGAFSGRLLMGPSTYTFSSQFYGPGSQQVQAHSGKQSVTVNLHLQMTGAPGPISGDVNGGTWDSPLSADLAPVWTAKNPSPLAGNYTMVLPGPVLPDDASIGDSFGVVTVSKLGVLSVVGSLADGSGFSQSVPVSGGQWPFYTYAASGKDTVLGWVDFSGGQPAGPNVSWIKAPTSGRYYAAGFDSVVQLIGSPYVAPAAKAPVLSLADPAVLLTGGDLSGNFSSAVTLQKTQSTRPAHGIDLYQPTGDLCWKIRP